MLSIGQFAEVAGDVAYARSGHRADASRLQHHHRGTDRHAIIEVDYILVDKSDAAARRRRADSIWFISSMQAEIGILAVTVEIKGPRPERIFNSA